MTEGSDNFAVAEFSHQADNFAVTFGAFFEQEFAPVNFDYRHLSSAQNSSSLSRPVVLICLSCSRTTAFICFESQQHAVRRKERNVLRFIASTLFVRSRLVLFRSDYADLARANGDHRETIALTPDANLDTLTAFDFDALSFHAAPSDGSLLSTGRTWRGPSQQL